MPVKALDGKNPLYARIKARLAFIPDLKRHCMGKKIKWELIQQVARIEGKSEREVKIIVRSFVNQIREALINGDDVILNNLGTFVLEDMPVRTIVNHLPGFDKEKYHIAPHESSRDVRTFYSGRLEPFF